MGINLEFDLCDRLSGGVGQFGSDRCRFVMMMIMITLDRVCLQSGTREGKLVGNGGESNTRLEEATQHKSLPSSIATSMQQGGSHCIKVALGPLHGSPGKWPFPGLFSALPRWSLRA